MNDAVPPRGRGRRSTTMKDTSSADPWWEAEIQRQRPRPRPSEQAVRRMLDTEAPRRRRLLPGSLPRVQVPGRAAVRVAGRVAWLVASHPFVRRHARLLAGVLMVLMLLAVALVVILLNNVVLQRTGELAKLDKQRRTLRTDNALMSAQIARLSAPPVIIRAANKRLGMTAPTERIYYVYLDPANAVEAARQQRLQRQRQQSAVQQSVPLPENPMNVLRRLPIVGTDRPAAAQ